MPGPPPKKDAERRRRNTTATAGGRAGSKSPIPAEVVDVDSLLAGDVEIPTPDPKWHPIATLIYKSQMASGQVIWMEPSDWAMLYTICESISRDMNPQPIGINEQTGKAVMATIPLKGASLAAYIKGLTSLLASEGARRTMRIELERQRRLDAAAAGDGKVVDIVGRRADLFGGTGTAR